MRTVYGPNPISTSSPDVEMDVDAPEAEKLPSSWLLIKRGARERLKHLLLLLLTLGTRFYLFQELPLPPRQ